MKKIKNLLFFCFSLMLTYNSLAQEKTITGTVMSATDKEPLPGVSVIRSNTTKGAETDFDGKYSVKAAKGDVLVFSYLGLKSKKVIINNDHSASKIELKVDLTMVQCVIMGRVAVKDVFSSKKNK